VPLDVDGSDEVVLDVEVSSSGDAVEVADTTVVTEASSSGGGRSSTITGGTIAKP
jgi:hypothetical protein